MTVAALVVGEHSGNLNFAKEHGLTEGKHKEIITHLAFYTGWPKTMTAVMIAKEGFENEK
ncbi:carboxymuconolactone decarboxylase family protein [uncultured Flavobacterium sp.]|uniref:carboxymuconolactone decarboxylase family protein n=1 Tax=uncultured Flavobacterium sp. TaxID=165435 RepID=UPI0030ECE036